MQQHVAWNRVQMLITTQASNLLLEFEFNWIIYYRSYFNPSMWKLWFSVFTTNHHRLCSNLTMFICACFQSTAEQWCRIWHPAAQREAAYCKWSCECNCWPAATSIRAEEDRTEEPAPPGPSRRWRREYHALLVSCKGNYCWLKLLNICLLAPQSTL